MKTKLSLLAVAMLMATGTANASDVEVSTKGGLKVKSGDYKFQLGGRIMYDYNKSEENGETDEDDFNLRRGRIYVKGAIGNDWEFKSQFNTNGGGVEDLYIKYKGWGKGANLTIGNQKMPFGLEELTSSKDISVLERSAITELYAIGRAEGVKLNGKLGGNATYSFGVFTDDEKDSEIGFATRYTWAPVKSDNAVLHLGLAYRDIDDDSALGLEVGAVTGPFHIQAEYVDAEFKEDLTGEDADGEEIVIGTFDDELDGFYVQAGYILTGESRPYKGGKFKRVKPSGKGGAWEVVARYEDGDGNHSDIELGRGDAKAYTLGLNWYAHKNVRLGVNYTDGESNTSSDDGNEFRVRFQLTF